MLKIIVESVTYFLNLGANVYPIVTKCLHINFGAGIATVLVKRIHFNISTTHMFWLSRSEAGSKPFDLVYKSASLIIIYLLSVVSPSLIWIGDRYW